MRKVHTPLYPGFVDPSILLSKTELHEEFLGQDCAPLGCLAPFQNGIEATVDVHHRTDGSLSAARVLSPVVG